MLLPLFLLFTLVPLVELWLLYQLSGVFGFWTTIAVVLLTGFAGAALAKLQGVATMFRIRSDLAQGVLPAQALGDGVLILVAAVLLITPGVLTDALGLSLLVPPLRSLIRKGLYLWFGKRIKVQTNLRWPGGEASTATDGTVVEGRVVEAHVVEDVITPQSAELGREPREE